VFVVCCCLPGEQRACRVRVFFSVQAPSSLSQRHRAWIKQTREASPRLGLALPFRRLISLLNPPIHSPGPHGWLADRKRPSCSHTSRQCKWIQALYTAAHTPSQGPCWPCDPWRPAVMPLSSALYIGASWFVHSWTTRARSPVTHETNGHLGSHCGVLRPGVYDHPLRDGRYYTRIPQTRAIFYQTDRMELLGRYPGPQGKDRASVFGPPITGLGILPISPVPCWLAQNAPHSETIDLCSTRERRPSSRQRINGGPEDPTRCIAGPRLDPGQLGVH
jgi:hypothetical protein